MTPYTFDFTRRSLTDLARIRDSIAAKSPQGAAGWVVDIFAAIYKLRDPPRRTVVIGHETSGGIPLRSLAVGNYMVYFRVIDQRRAVRVLRVRHGARRALRRYG